MVLLVRRELNLRANFFKAPTNSLVLSTVPDRLWCRGTPGWNFGHLPGPGIIQRASDIGTMAANFSDLVTVAMSRARHAVTVT